MALFMKDNDCMSRFITKYILGAAAALIAGILSTGCIEDGVTTSAADQPEFSTDTLSLGRVFTEAGTPTSMFKVYNRHDKILNISDISFKDGGTGYFRINVDGLAGTRFSNVEIRPNDSIFVFVEATLPEVGSGSGIDIEDVVEFVTNGVTSQVVLTAQGRDVERLRGVVLTADTRFDTTKPYQIFDSLVVGEGATLTLDEGVELYFHDGARLKVEGTLVSLGSADKPVKMGGDRTGYVAADIPYEVMSRQWEGVEFTPTSHSNRLSYTVIENTWSGVKLDSISRGDTDAAALEMVNCRLRNSAAYALEAHHSNVRATGCEFAEGGSGVVYLRGGDHAFDHCTIANYYLFSFIGGAMMTLDHRDDATDDGSGLPYLSATVSNSIFYGSGAELSVGDLEGTSVWIRRCLLGSSGTDDEHFTDILWATDPEWLVDRERYIFDYRLKEGSPALGASMSGAASPKAPTLPATDFYGGIHPMPASIGAMERG